jgi:hypothetical protein
MPNIAIQHYPEPPTAWASYNMDHQHRRWHNIVCWGVMLTAIGSNRLKRVQLTLHPPCAVTQCSATSHDHKSYSTGPGAAWVSSWSSEDEGGGALRSQFRQPLDEPGWRGDATHRSGPSDGCGVLHSCGGALDGWSENRDDALGGGVPHGRRQVWADAKRAHESRWELPHDRADYGESTALTGCARRERETRGLRGRRRATTVTCLLGIAAASVAGPEAKVARSTTV